MGVAVGDYDNDGKADLFVTALDRNRLYRNTGSEFVDVAARAGVRGSGMVRRGGVSRLRSRWPARSVCLPVS